MSEKSFEQEYQRLAASDVQLPKNDAAACDITCIEVEDDRSGMAIETLRRAITDNLYCIRGKDERFATSHDYYVALAHSVRDRLLHRRIQTAKTYAREDAKTVYYLSAEFLMGRHLANGLINLGIFESIREVLQGFGLNLEDLLEQEGEPGLGNGGLGRLAACFLDSLATLEIPAVGYGIRYEYGIFKQAIQNGEQIEIPDKWLGFGNPWEIARPEYRVEVKLGGYTEPYIDARGHYRVRWVPGQKISGVPHDMPIPGYDTNTVNTLRLWKAEASEEFDLQAFNAGDYFGAVADKTISENISKVLYPNDTTPQGKQLRLEQQYFFVSCSLQDIVRLHLRTHPNLDNFQVKAAIQLNDTHPAVAIAELMRLLIDEHEYDWDRAWAISQQTFAYTNHTLLPEALEKWSVELFGRLLPRHLEIIYEINHRFLASVRLHYPGDTAKLERMSLIEEGPVKQVRMANLACVGSHKVNGVAALHTELLKRDVLHDFYDLWPEKFVNVTNGVTPRRWLMLSNPGLARLITETIGSDWPAHLDELRQLAAYAEDSDFCDRWYRVKQANKEALAKYIWEHNGIETDLGSIFDIQVKRIHEYKRQLMNVLHIITLYHRLKRNPSTQMVPRTFIFGGKAAPGYFLAKKVIHLINNVAAIVNRDADVAGRIKVVFLANYSVSLGQRVYPAADLSEQISTAGMEASGTGNMKFSINGALTIGTLDGANIEIREAVGAENFFLFGLTAEEVKALKAGGYSPASYYEKNVELRDALDSLVSGEFSGGDRGLFASLFDSLVNGDRFMLLADYQAYVDCQERVAETYRDREVWTRMSVLNAARVGTFSSDRTISQYCEKIWQVNPLPVGGVTVGNTEAATTSETVRG